MNKIIDQLDQQRDELQRLAATPITMSNYKTQMRAYQQMLFTILGLNVDMVELIMEDSATPLADPLTSPLEGKDKSK